MPFKESEGFPEAFDRFEKWNKANDIHIHSNNDMFLHFMTWGSMKGPNYTPMTKKQIRNMNYEAKKRGYGYANREKNKSSFGGEFKFRDMVTGRFIKEDKYLKQNPL